MPTTLMQFLTALDANENLVSEAETALNELSQVSIHSFAREVVFEDSSPLCGFSLIHCSMSLSHNAVGPMH